jgi:hypothetical protein
LFEQKYPRWLKLKVVKTNFECLSILDDLGYLPAVANSDQTISDIIRECLNQMGKSYSKAILYNTCLLYGLSEHELLTNYDLFEKSLNRVLGKSGNAIVSRIKKGMLTYAVMSRSDITVQDILNPSLKIEDIVKYIREAEIFNFVSKIPYDHHAILLYSRENNKNKILTQFLNPNGSSRFDRDINKNHAYCGPIGLLSSNQTVANNNNNNNNSPLVNNLSYEEIFQGVTTDDMVIKKKLSNWIADLCPSNKSPQYYINNNKDNQNNQNKSTTTAKTTTTRIAQEDGTWWLRNDHIEELEYFEQLLNDCKSSSIGNNNNNNLSALCVFDISQISTLDMSTIMRQIISYHDSVIIDEPFTIYTRALRSNNNNNKSTRR